MAREDLEKCLGKTDAECLCANTRRAARAVTRYFDHVLDPSGLRATQFTLLLGIRLNQPVGITRLAEYMVMDRTTMTRNLRPLEKAGLISVGRAGDRRLRAIRLTSGGEESLEAALPAWSTAQAALAKAVGHYRKDIVVGNLKAVADAACRILEADRQPSG